MANQSIALPLYFDAVPANDPQWTQLGPQPDVLGIFDDMSKLRQVHGTVRPELSKIFGYVDTATGTVPQATVVDKITAWFTQFPDLDGIFFDEGPPQNSANPAKTEDPTFMQYYYDLYPQVQQIADSVNPGGGQKLLMLNAAGCRDELVLTACAMAVLVEKESASYFGGWWNGASEPWWVSQPDPSRIVHVVHSCPDFESMCQVVAWSRVRNAGNIYVYDGTSASYGHLPAYWSQEKDSVSSPNACKPIADTIAALQTALNACQAIK